MLSDTFAEVLSVSVSYFDAELTSRKNPLINIKYVTRIKLLQSAISHFNNITSFTVNNILHKIGSPAVINWERGLKIKETYYNHGILHRVTGPAIIKYELDGESYKGFQEIYYINGKIHRKGLPAIIYYKKMGQKFVVISIKYYSQNIPFNGNKFYYAKFYYANDQKYISEAIYRNAPIKIIYMGVIVLQYTHPCRDATIRCKFIYDGTVMREVHCKMICGGMQDCEIAPSLIKFTLNSAGLFMPSVVQWFRDGKLHKSNTYPCPILNDVRE